MGASEGPQWDEGTPPKLRARLGAPHWGPLLALARCHHPPHGAGNHLEDPAPHSAGRGVVLSSPAGPLHHRDPPWDFLPAGHQGLSPVYWGEPRSGSPPCKPSVSPSPPRCCRCGVWQLWLGQAGGRCKADDELGVGGGRAGKFTLAPLDLSLVIGVDHTLAAPITRR